MKRIAVITLFVLVSAYALFQARSLILGPRIYLESPEHNSSLPAGVVTAKGVVRNATHITLNDKTIFIDLNGQFEEKLIVHEGVNIIKFVAEDRFGREREKLVRIVGN